MKKIIMLPLLILMSADLIAQEDEPSSRFKLRMDDETETLANRKGGFGGFLEFNTMPTYLNGQPALMTGGGVAMVFGHSLNLGFAGYGLVSDVASDVTDSTGNFYHLQTGYGGMMIEPVFFSKKLIHVTLPVLLGVGATSLTNSSIYQYENYPISWADPEMYFVVRPGINIEINLLRILRLDLGISYRFTSGYQMQHTSAGDLNGFSGNIGLKLGWF